MIDKGFRALAWLSATLVLVILGLIVFTMVHESWPVFQKEGLGFVFSNNWSPAFNHFGAGAFLWGTIVASTIAVIIAVPVSIGLALFATEVAPKRVRRPVVYVIDLLAVIPQSCSGCGDCSFSPRRCKGFSRTSRTPSRASRFSTRSSAVIP
jgi:phosphate transport system permease protein